MELLFQILLVLGVVKYGTKAGFYSGYKGFLFFSLFAGIVALIFYPFIITINTNVLDEYLSNKTIVSNLAVIVTIEAISGMLISVGMLHNLFENRKQKWVRILKLTPGVIIIGVIFYFELFMFKYMVGYEFVYIAIIVSFIVIAATAIVALGIKYLMPENSSRYELKFLINVILLIIAILMNAGLADYNKSYYESNIEYINLIVFTGITLIGFALGILYFNNKELIKKRIKTWI